ncbi:nucleotide sugar dehydrogenase [Streptomyces hoynatensis]|uniref:nucleotide sugar dehydrogenase n=1 Tax=Streptomyces hoynatensis TaxID=1141874 RepID=UPI001F4EFC97|nr:nucleotide sugar dehydrogenase [Streptomyces hoynatensis]
MAVVGLGYVGLPTALALRAADHRVIGLDNRPERLAEIEQGRADLIPADRERLRAHRGRPAFELTTDPARLGAADAVLVCVPTPVDARLVPDLGALRAACATVVERAVPGQTLILTSTSYVGTTRDLLVKPLAARGLVPSRDLFVAFAPERIDPGRPAHMQQNTPRVVGGVGRSCGERAAEVLRETAGGVRLVGSAEAAEMCKLLENTFRAVNIAFANEFATACGALGLDPAEVLDAAATKPFGFMPFAPGPGAGGHCIPCDPHYLLWQLRGGPVSCRITEAAMNALAERPHRVAERALETLAEHGVARRGARVLLLGVAYKSGVADVRESPALTIIGALARAGAEVAYCDPLVPALTVDGRPVPRVTDPVASEWDLVLAHTLHPGQDLGWLDGTAPVLDATYRLADLARRSVV